MADLKEMITSIIDMWYKCHPEPILITDESELEGEMKIHHALPDYIHRRLEPELKVDLPNVPEKPTQQQAIATRALREKDEALAEHGNEDAVDWEPGDVYAPDGEILDAEDLPENLGPEPVSADLELEEEFEEPEPVPEPVPEPLESEHEEEPIEINFDMESESSGSDSNWAP
ncbi:uncharacterized protein LOC130140284 [Syzygium oleosum]|uniref:uncharacterized protein LOC130140284 n=1 Tax=Syzygium oleosum TaxID=219896 RepID=UPI0024B9B8EC|nr:uncharacterized protein LOC130140284 [Syzygium oleosum]